MAGRLFLYYRLAAATRPPARRAASHWPFSRRRPAARPATGACSGFPHSYYNNSVRPRPRPRLDLTPSRRAPRSLHPRPRATAIGAGGRPLPHLFVPRRAPIGAELYAFALPRRMRGARRLASLRWGSDAMEARLRCRRGRWGAAMRWNRGVRTAAGAGGQRFWRRRALASVLQAASAIPWPKPWKPLPGAVPLKLVHS